MPSTSAGPRLDALRGLARAVAFDARLDVVLGAPGGGWSLDPQRGEIRCDPSDLERAHPDDVRSLVCHEAAHWAVTRYPALVPPSVLAEPGMAPLLNALEDCRIESWLAHRFPGTAAWIRRTNERLIPVSLEALPAQPRAHQFCLSAILLWWQRTTDRPPSLPEGLDPAVVHALERTDGARYRAEALLPPVDALAADGEGYAESPVARRFVRDDLRRPPDPFERSVRLISWRWWSLVHREIRPAYQELVALDHQDRPDVAEVEERLVRRLRGLVPGDYGAFGAQRTAGAGERAVPDSARLLASVAETPSAYEAARREVAPLVERTCEALLPLVTRDRMPSWGGAHPSGGRVDLRRVVQAEADPRRRDRLWQRKSLPVRRDPVVQLLVDVSGSMAGERIEAAFAATVLLCEVLDRLRIPFGVAGFQDVLIDVKAPGDPLDADTRRRIGSLPLEVLGLRAGGRNRPEANHDGPVLLTAAASLVAQPARERWLWVLSDGLPTGPHDGVAALRQAVERVYSDGRVRLVGIGLGPGTGHVASFYDPSLPEVPIDALPDALGGLVGRLVAGAL